MASLKDIKRKVSAVQKTKQITRAMNMVAASKFKSAQVKMENFRPYAGKFMDVLKQCSSSCGYINTSACWRFVIPRESELFV